MSRVSATYSGEEITVTFSEEFVLDDYGVHGSPTFLSAQGDVEIESLDILGQEYNLSAVEKQLKELVKNDSAFKQSPIGDFIERFSASIYALEEELDYPDNGEEPDYDDSRDHD